MAPKGPRRSPRKSTKSKTQKVEKKSEPPLPSIKWTADGGALIWALIAQLEVKENRLVLFGKENKGEISPSHTGVVVFPRHLGARGTHRKNPRHSLIGKTKMEALHHKWLKLSANPSDYIRLWRGQSRKETVTLRHIRLYAEISRSWAKRAGSGEKAKKAKKASGAVLL
ncbi:hypothetical protein C8R47DRAFT_1192193 [Mycena vitilis]|nr:hypothetical protein C8R47DRAFT_1192193 [Mycena vitilis]